MKYCGREGNKETKCSNTLEEEWEGFDEEYIDYDNFENSSEEEPWKLDLKEWGRGEGGGHWDPSLAQMGVQMVERAAADGE